ncbi:phosphoadenylyl-sulfate reductase [Paenochrobactrum glaciei]|uniref:Adenosine 5'-phosphosulfate reductase n=1 Tax=Paenochrobactrum glaciei TaxID=486407 RepID=A0ABN1FPF7_9HYPH
MPPEPQLNQEIRVAAQARLLEASHGAREPQVIIEQAHRVFGLRALALVSSFGAESAVLLHMVAQIDPNIPVLFLDTGKHFTATLDYRHQLTQQLGLQNVQDITPLTESLRRDDPYGALSMTDKDRCCFLRKVEPMTRAVAPFKAWMTGRKQFQAATRQHLPSFEAVGVRIRINPLAHWQSDDLITYMRHHDLLEHPLTLQNYRSIGCMPCTRPVEEGEDQRAGRWAGSDKTECGIHLSGLTQQLEQKGAIK